MGVNDGDLHQNLLDLYNSTPYLTLPIVSGKYVILGMYPQFESYRKPVY